MEFTTCFNLVTHERYILLEFLYELSNELYLLVLPTKNKNLPNFVFFDELRVFLRNS